MPGYITVAKPPLKTVEEFDKLAGSVDQSPIEGMEARYVGTTDGELRIIVLWESKAHADKFFTERLAPALAKQLGPEPSGAPEITGVEVQRSYVPETVA